MSRGRQIAEPPTLSFQNLLLQAEVVNEQDQEDQQGLAEDDEGDEEGEGYKGKILKRLGKRRK